jgi:protein-tyrosine-phosphatase
MKQDPSLEDSVCFVCWHGIGLSVFCKDYFEDFLKSIRVNNVKVYSAGIQWVEQRYADRIKNADLVVITLPEIQELEVREKFDFEGRIYRLEESRITVVENKDKKWQQRVYSALVEK